MSNVTDDSRMHPDAWLDQANQQYAAEKIEAKQAGTPFTEQQRRTRRAAIRSEYDARAEAWLVDHPDPAQSDGAVDTGVDNPLPPVDNQAPFVVYVYVSANWQLMPAIDAALALFAAEHAGQDVVLVSNSGRAVDVWVANGYRAYLYPLAIGEKHIVTQRRMIYSHHVGGAVRAGIVIATLGDPVANPVMQDLSDLGVPYDVLNFGRQTAREG
jgi:hypothetical protein